VANFPAKSALMAQPSPTLLSVSMCR
jgi:hypothetical protein